MRATIVLAALSAIMPLAAAVPAADGADILAPRDSDDDTFAPILHTFNIPDLEQRALYQPETCTSSQKRCGLTCIPISEDCCALDREYRVCREGGLNILHLLTPQLMRSTFIHAARAPTATRRAPPESSRSASVATPRMVLHSVQLCLPSLLARLHSRLLKPSNLLEHQNRRVGRASSRLVLRLWTVIQTQ